MAETSKIEWTDATFNPWTGCTKVSPGCDGCYAESWSKRAGPKVGKWGAGAPRVRTTAANWRLPVKWNAQHDEFIAQHGRRRRVFCASLADVFDNEVDPEWRRDLFRLIAHTKNLDWLLLTKRIGNAAKMLQDTAASFGFDWSAQPWEHVWLGATIVNQQEADRDIPKLLATPAAVRFLSMEPLLAAVDLMPTFTHAALTGYGSSGVDWVIAGGESGPGARPMHPDWVRGLRDQCAAAGVPFLMKQWGEWRPTVTPYVVDEAHNCKPIHRFPCGQLLAKVGKKAAGRSLDGVMHDGFPSGVATDGGRDA